MTEGISDFYKSHSQTLAEGLTTIPRKLRTLKEKVMTTALRVFGYNPATFYEPYQQEQIQNVLCLASTINNLKDQKFTSPEAHRQHAFSLLAKLVSYCDFETLPNRIKKALFFDIPLEGGVHRYKYDRTVPMAGFCECTILTAPGAPPLALIPGTYPWLDHPSKFLGTVGANLQGTTWKPVGDEILHKLVPLLEKISQDCGAPREPRFHILGHSAGASAVRLALSQNKDLPAAEREVLFSGRFHAFSPPATSHRRAAAINRLPEQKTKHLLTTYIDAEDPIAHMGGTTHAGKIIIAPPSRRTSFESHALPPPLKYLGDHVVAPYDQEHVEIWSINMTVAKVTIAFLALVNVLGIKALISTLNHVVEGILRVTIQLVRALFHLSVALIDFTHLQRLKHALVETGKGAAKVVLATALFPFLFLNSYWNEILVPAIYSATGLNLHLRNFAEEALRF